MHTAGNSNLGDLFVFHESNRELHTSSSSLINAVTFTIIRDKLEHEYVEVVWVDSRIDVADTYRKSS